MFRPGRGIPPDRHGQATEFRLYDSDTEVEHRFTELIALVAWLDEHEHERAGFTTVQNWLLDDLLPRQIERWSREGGDL